MAVFQRKGREEMKGYQVYSKVHQMREAGFSQRAIAKALGINRKTVKRYWDMDVDEYEHNARKIVRIRNLDPHRDQIVDGGWTKVYVAAFLLSHSRYKYAQCQSRPFTAVDLVTACHNCFRYWGGMPREMVFDQDSIVCVSENSGDIIYTYEFEKFRQDCRMEIYLCRGADPESNTIS